jgi:hypothetical protein
MRHNSFMWFISKRQRRKIHTVLYNKTNTVYSIYMYGSQHAINFVLGTVACITNLTRLRSHVENRLPCFSQAIGLNSSPSPPPSIPHIHTYDTILNKQKTTRAHGNSPWSDTVKYKSFTGWNT